MDMEINPAWLRDGPLWAVAAPPILALIYWLQRVIRGDIKSDRREAAGDKMTENLMTLWKDGTARYEKTIADLAVMIARAAALEKEISELRVKLADTERELLECQEERKKIMQDLRSHELALQNARAEKNRRRDDIGPED